MQSPAQGPKFCGARAGVACVMLAHAAGCLAFHAYFESTSPKQYTGLPHPGKVLDFFCCPGKSLNFVCKSWKVLENIYKVFQ